MRQYAVVILAAGASRRFGAPKQLYKWNGRRPLLQIAIDATLGARTAVVIGANAEKIRPLIQDRPVEIVMNHDWHEGVASSIRAGVKSVCADADGVVLMPCDQPLTEPAVIRALFETHERTGKPIVACAYGGTLGTPAFFAREYFDHLLALRGDTGAKRVIMHCRSDVATVAWPDGALDVDTVESKLASRGVGTGAEL